MGLLCDCPLHGDDFEWQSPVGAIFNFNATWRNVTTNSGPPAGPPCAEDTAIFDLSTGFNHVATLLGPTATDQLIVRNDNVTFDLRTFTYKVGSDVTLGEFGHNATLAPTNGTFSAVDDLVVSGQLSTGTLTVTNFG